MEPKKCLKYLHDATITHDTDEISRLNGAQPVGDDEHSAPPGGPVERLLHHPLGLCIQSTGGFIQNQDRGVLDQGAGDGDALFLATGQRYTSLTWIRQVWSSASKWNANLAKKSRRNIPTTVL